ncbi:hypothetical protein [Streptomyces sp. NPDC002889]
MHVRWRAHEHLGGGLGDGAVRREVDVHLVRAETLQMKCGCP